jgi:hypothetical protein
VDKLAIAIALGFCAGILSGLFGVGGGILFVPTLALALGLSQIEAEATSLLATLPVAAVGTWRQRRYGNVAFRPAVAVGIASVPAVVVGALLALSLDETWLRRLFGLLVIAVAVQIAHRALRPKGVSLEA